MSEPRTLADLARNFEERANNIDSDAARLDINSHEYELASARIGTWRIAAACVRNLAKRFEANAAGLEYRVKRYRFFDSIDQAKHDTWLSAARQQEKP